MLYLIDPRGAVWQSADYTLAKAVARQRVDGRPVDDLPLATARLEIDAADALDLALRHGLAARNVRLGRDGRCRAGSGWGRDGGAVRPEGSIPCHA